MLKLIMSNFWKNEVPKGYYDTSILFDKNSKRNIQSNWHKKTFSAVNSYIKDDDIVLDFAYYRSLHTVYILVHILF